MPESSPPGDSASPAPHASAGRVARCHHTRSRPGPAVALAAAAGLLIGGCQHFGGTEPDPSTAAVGDGPESGTAAAQARPGRAARSVRAPGGDPSTTEAARAYVGLMLNGAEPPAAETGAGDLLARLRAGFALPAGDSAAVAGELAWFGAEQAYFDRVFGRASRYLFHITGELEARGMPMDYALLPVIESAFDPFAYSHGRAAGLWQIIPGTGRRFGLRQNWWYDGRRDVLESTRAALDYLQYLHELFDGDWLLATAAYNAGEGNVRRAIRRAEAAGEPIDFWGLRRHLPRETRTYVPRLLALRDIVADPDTHGLTLPPISDEPQFAVVETGGQIDIALAAQLAGLGIERIYELNPGVNRWATDPDGPHRLVVPLTHAETLADGIAGLGERERVRWTRHRIEPGETLIGLATRYRTTVDVLRDVNDLRGSTIRAGDHLMVPHAMQSLTAYTQSADARANAQRSREREGARVTHVVASGESLWTISRRFGVGVRELASWNAMAPGDVLGVGSELVVWTGAAAGDAGTAVTRPVLAANAPTRQVTYTVRRGDSLYSIAQRFRVTIANLLEWNQVSMERYLQPGQRLIMYVNVADQSG